jgi:hypothetical protein
MVSELVDEKARGLVRRDALYSQPERHAKGKCASADRGAGSEEVAV